MLVQLHLKKFENIQQINNINYIFIMIKINSMEILNEQIKKEEYLLLRLDIRINKKVPIFSLLCF